MATNKSKKKKLMAASAGLALVAAVSGTFAWYTAQDQKINRVSTASMDGSVTVVETWEPGPIVPNTEAKKEVHVTNTGKAPVVVRVSYEEVLKHLTNKGDVTRKATPYTKPTVATLKDDIPVPFSGDQYTAAQGYTDVTSKVMVAGNPLPANVKVWAKGSATENAVTGEVVTDFEYVMFNEYVTGEYQKMDSKMSISGNTAGTPITDWTLEADGLAYHVYEQGYTYTTANWAKSAFGSEFSAPDGYALLGGSGQKYGVTFDYTLPALDLAALPGITPGSGNQIPTTSGDIKEVQTDMSALGKSGIQIRYGDDMTDVTGTLAPEKWVYNPEDGWFYYTSPIANGTSTKQLMKALKFTSDVGDEFNQAVFDLVVKMEAIQGTETALTDTVAGWGMDLSQEDSATEIIGTYIISQLPQ